jgi:hypothetical protein
VSRRNPVRNVRAPAAKEFVKALEGLAYRRSRWEAFADWTILAASSIYNGIHHDPVIEAEYLAVANRYTADELRTMAMLLALTIDGLEVELSDFLGQVYEGSMLANEGHGQFFTPFSVSQMLAAMTFSGDLPANRIITISEPTCGAGGMAVAICSILRDRSFDFQNYAYIEAQDIDPLCFRMTYIQLSLVGASATVILGDTLKMERSRIWTTPMYSMTQMGPRLAAQNGRNEAWDPQPQVHEQVAGPQLELFGVSA